MMRTSFPLFRLLLGLPLAFTTALLPAQEIGPNTAIFDFALNGSTRRVMIELDEDAAPRTVANFREMVGQGYYNGLAVHRAIPNYLIQLGDPYTRDDSQKALWGTGGPEHSVPSEAGLKHVRGSVAMARLPGSSDSSGSQFFIALADLPQLDGTYTVFGKVVRGIEFLDQIALQTTDTNDVPLRRILITASAAGRTPGGLAINPGILKQPVSGAASGIKGASDAMRGAGSRMANAIKDADLPDVPRPRLPSFGGSRDEEAPAPEATMPATPQSGTGNPAPSVGSRTVNTPSEPESIDVAASPPPREEASSEPRLLSRVPRPSWPFSSDQLPAASEEVATAQKLAGEVFTSENLASLPPELSEAAASLGLPEAMQESPSLSDDDAPAAPGDPEASPADGPAPEKQRLSLEVPPKPSSEDDEKDGFISRAVKRVW